MSAITVLNDCIPYEYENVIALFWLYLAGNGHYWNFGIIRLLAVAGMAAKVSGGRRDVIRFTNSDGDAYSMQDSWIKR